MALVHLPFYFQFSRTPVICIVSGTLLCAFSKNCVITRLSRGSTTTA